MFGRLISVSGTEVTLDYEVLIEAGQSYDIVVPGNDGELQTRSVVASPGYTGVVTISSPFSPDPVVGAVWQMIGSNLAPRRFRVLTNEEKEDGTYAITALLYDPNKQARIEEGILLSLPSVTSFQTGPIAAPTGVAVSELIRRGLAAPGCRSSWSAGTPTLMRESSDSTFNTNSTARPIGSIMAPRSA